MLAALSEARTHPSAVFQSAKVGSRSGYSGAQSRKQHRARAAGKAADPPATPAFAVADAVTSPDGDARITIDAGLQQASRRQLLCRAAAVWLVWTASEARPVAAKVNYEPVTIQPKLAPKQSTFDPTDEDLRDAAALLQKALNAEEVEVCIFQLDFI